MTYKVVTLPAQFDGTMDKAANQYEATINAQAAEGWKLITVSAISSKEKKGCLKNKLIIYEATLLIFGKE